MTNEPLNISDEQLFLLTGTHKGCMISHRNMRLYEMEAETNSFQSKIILTFVEEKRGVNELPKQK
jgi:hypothetical protein